MQRYVVAALATGVLMGCGKVSEDSPAAEPHAPAPGSASLSESEYKALVSKACQASTLELEQPRTAFYWIVDSSASMTTLVEGGAHSAWEVTRDAVLAGMREVIERDQCHGRSLGLLTVSGVEASELPSPQECLDTTNEAFESWDQPPSDVLATMSGVLSMTKPHGVTPLADAHRRVYERIRAQPQADNSRIIVVTDGKPSVEVGCQYPAPSEEPDKHWGTGGVDDLKVATTGLEQAIREASANDVSTYIVAAPGRDEAEFRRLATNTGSITPECADNCFYRVDGGFSWLSYIAATASEISPRTNCRISRGSVPESYYRFSLVLTTGSGERLQLSEQSSLCEEGFWISSQYEATLCPKTCAAFRADCEAKLETVYECR